MEDEIKCTLCHNNKITYIPNKIRNDEDGIYRMYRCEKCETHFLYPRPMDAELKDYYDGHFREEVHSSRYYDKESLDRVFTRFSGEANLRVQRVEKELSKEDRVLEIGCSVGYFLKAVSPYVGKVCGTEWDKKAQQYIRDCFGKDGIEVQINPEDYEGGFDKIFLFHVLEHIEEPIAFLKNLKKKLNPGGCIYIEVPNVDDVLVKTYECDAFKDFYYKKAHLYNFNDKGLSYLFEQAEYEYEINYIQRYDLSNHLYWLGKGLPGGKGAYETVLGTEVNEAYVSALKAGKQTDTLFAKIWI